MQIFAVIKQMSEAESTSGESAIQFIFDSENGHATVYVQDKNFIEKARVRGEVRITIEHVE